MLPGNILAIVLSLLAASRCCEAASNSTQWWNGPFGMLQTNLREIDADMDVNEVARFTQEYGATAWLISVGGILANYPTKLDFQIENRISSERKSGDLIQDALGASKVRGLRLLGRMDFSKVQASVAKAHPDWLYISPNGTWQNHTNGLVSVCPSGKWYQERVFDILDEVMSLYKLDGFFVNWAGYNERDYFRVYHGVCHCESCKARWENYSNGKQLPAGPWSDAYDEWKTFSDGIIDEWTGRVRTFIAERLPNAGLILGESSDIMFHESNNAVGRDIWHHATAETVSKHKSYRPEVPVLVNAASFLDIQYRFAAENSLHYLQYHIQAISRGANPSTYIIGAPGKIPWPAMEKTGELMRFYHQWQTVYSGLKPAAKTGLVMPSSSIITNDTLYEFALSEYKGIYMALQELHVPFDIISETHIVHMVENGSLQRYNAIILPNLGELPSASAEALDNWVSSGRTLVATGLVGLDSDNITLQLKSLPATQQTDWLEDEASLWSTYLAPEQNSTEEHYYNGPIIPIVGSYGAYKWKGNATGFYKKLAYAPFAPPEYIYGNTQIDERGVGIASYENGKAVLVPFTPGRGYYEVGMGVFRDFLGLILHEVGTQERISFHLSPHVEVTVHENSRGKTVLHFINFSGMTRQNFGTSLPIPAGSLTISGELGNVKAIALTSNSTLEVQQNGVVELPGFDQYEVVVIEGLD